MTSTQEVLATKGSLHRVTLAKIETGALAPSLKTLARLAQAPRPAGPGARRVYGDARGGTHDVEEDEKPR